MDNYFEGNFNLPSSPTYVREELKRLEQEISALSQTTKAKTLKQDGKIYELETYIKENLSKELKSMIATMDFTDELDKLVSETLVKEYNLIYDSVYPIGHVKRYGGKGDGTCDDTLAINRAINDCKRYDKPLLADSGEYKITSDVNMRFITNINFQGNIVTENESKVIIGHNAGWSVTQNINFNSVPNLKVIGLKNSTLNFQNVTNLELYANGDSREDYSLAYNNINGAVCTNISIHSEGTEIGWINENVFRIKRIQHLSMTGNYNHNNNHFEHSTFEESTFNLDRARNNYFKGRGEGGMQITTSDETNSNFIEKEFYYRHYFGIDVKEHPGTTFEYHPVNKLQTEEKLYRLDYAHKDYPLTALIFRSDGTFRGNTFQEIYHSNLIKIDKSFAIKTKSNTDTMRVQVNFYDENKNLITDPVTNFNDGNLKYQAVADWQYHTTSNVASDTITVWPGQAKYMEFRVIFGNNTEDTNLLYVDVTLLKMVTSSIHVLNTVKTGTFTQIPTEGYHERGEIWYAANPQATGYIGIVCTETGYPGSWEYFGSLRVPEV